MKCPYCNNVDSKVLDTRTMDDNTATKRRRLCEACGRRFTTYERIDTIPLTVIKSNGLRETFDRNKLFNGIMKACNKRPVPATEIEAVVDEIESTALNSMKREVDSKEIGEMVMDKLKSIDEIAYVRFASVYRQFKDLDSFMEELHKMLKEKNK